MSALEKVLEASPVFVHKSVAMNAWAEDVAVGNFWAVKRERWRIAQHLKYLRRKRASRTKPS